MKILLGPAGIPIACKTNNSADGVKTVAELGLQAMEIEFVQGVHMSNETAKTVGKVAEDFGIQLSVHAPYAINLGADKKQILLGSTKRILQTVERAHHMKARIVAIHSGYYGKFSLQQAFEKIRKAYYEIFSAMKQNGWDDVLLGCETTGRRTQWGTLDEVLRMAKAVKGCYPYIDFAHLFVKNGGVIDYKKIFDELEKFGVKEIFSHFEGVAKRSEHFVDIHTPINTHPPFEPLVKELLKRKIDCTIICESPLLEQDSLKMKTTFKKLDYKFR